MRPMSYIGLDVHKQKISYCVKDSGGELIAGGWIPATRFDLDRSMKTLPQPWSAPLEATLFSGWIYDQMLRAIARKLIQREACQALPFPDWVRERKLAMLPLISFETAGKTQTQSSGQPDELHQQIDVGFYPRIETAAERPRRRAQKRSLHPCSSRAHQEGFLSLDKGLS